MNNTFPLNTWLISNSSIYFANEIIHNKNNPVNPYTLFDFSKITEAILLSEKIVTLPSSNNNENELFKILKKDNLIEEIDPDEDEYVRKEVIGISRGAMRDIDLLDKEELARIIYEIFPISNKTNVLELIYNISEYCNKYWPSPDWSAKQWLLNGLSDEFEPFKTIPSHYFSLLEIDPAKYSTFDDALIFDYKLNGIIVELLTRSLLYLKLASHLGLNYAPDSVRVPIIASINRSLRERIEKYIQNQIADLEEYDKIFKQNLNREVTYDKYEIDIPACLVYLLNKYSRQGSYNESFRYQLINKLMELRYSKELINYREYLSETLDCIKNKTPNEVYKQIKRPPDTLKDIPLKDRLIAEKSNIFSLAESISSGDPGSSTIRSINLGASLISYIHDYFSSKKIIFYKNLSDELRNIASINDKIKNTFNKGLSDNQLNIFSKLRGFQIDYLNTGLQKHKE